KVLLQWGESHASAKRKGFPDGNNLVLDSYKKVMIDYQIGLTGKAMKIPPRGLFNYGAPGLLTL
ncbi:MAG: hypothetical protein Q7J61_02340, partial [Deltaproteobacteria bacterium]|nr:hypothetical protein [Deltaproteobacteria bacterium]